MIHFIQAASADEVENARMLFREYEAWLGIDLCFQGFDDELATLPGRYAAPDGRLLLAYADDKLVGCVAMRKIGRGACEMKRLYVRPEFRGSGYGNNLLEKVVDDARLIGYVTMKLDTYPTNMEKAVKLYKSHGFSEIPPYYDDPHEGVLFMELSLVP